MNPPRATRVRSVLSERFGLFTILVHGEAIEAVTAGLGDVEWRFSTTLVGIFGLGVATCFWWSYFDHHEGSVVRRRGAKHNWKPTVWIYSHLPLAVAVAVFGLSVEVAIVAAEPGHTYTPAQRWLLLGVVALALVLMAAIQSTLLQGNKADLRRSIITHRLIGVPVVLAIGLIPNLSAPWTMGLVIALATGEVVSDLVAANPGGLRAVLQDYRAASDRTSSE